MKHKLHKRKINNFAFNGLMSVSIHPFFSQNLIHMYYIGNDLNILFQFSICYNDSYSNKVLFYYIRQFYIVFFPLVYCLHQIDKIILNSFAPINGKTKMIEGGEKCSEYELVLVAFHALHCQFFFADRIYNKT